MRRRMFALLMGVLLFWAVSLSAQKKAGATRRGPAVAIDGHQAYKANCLSCHLVPPKYSARREATVMLHMRVRASLTEDETEAILRYLTK